MVDPDCDLKEMEDFVPSAVDRSVIIHMYVTETHITEFSCQVSLLVVVILQQVTAQAGVVDLSDRQYTFVACPAIGMHEMHAANLFALTLSHPGNTSRSPPPILRPVISLQKCLGCQIMADKQVSIWC